MSVVAALAQYEDLLVDVLTPSGYLAVARVDDETCRHLGIVSHDELAAAEQAGVWLYDYHTHQPVTLHPTVECDVLACLSDDHSTIRVDTGNRWLDLSPRQARQLVEQLASHLNTVVSG